MQLSRKTQPPAKKTQPLPKSAQPLKKKSTMQKQIPTLLGVGVLLVGLVAGLLMFSGGTGVFAPRATPQTTPKNTKVTNLSDKSFTVSFYTAESTAGFVKYGTNENSLKLQANDDRDQLSGSVGQYSLHHVTIRGLTPGSNYYYVLGTGSNSEFDNNGTAFTIKTHSSPTGSPPLSKTIYGTVASATSAPAEGAVVFVSAQGMGDMSALVKSSGSWAIALASARKNNGTGYAEITEESPLNVIVQGVDLNQTALFSTNVADAQPVAELTLAVGGGAAGLTSSSGGGLTADQVTEKNKTTSTDSTESTSNSTGSTGSVGNRGDLLNSLTGDDSEAIPVINLDQVDEDETPITTTEPVINGVVAPNVEVLIEIHSSHEITQTVTADEDGNFTIDIAALQKQLEPGEHTITYSYTDPDTDELITKTQTFLVEDDSLAGGSEKIAQGGIGDSESVFGSGNPVPLETPTPTPEVEEATSGASTRSAVVATDSGTYTAGSVGATFAMIAGGLFFIFAGWWSWWLANEAREVIA